MHLALRPGTDGALACAVMHVLFKEGYRRPRLPARATPTTRTGSKRISQTRTPEWAAAITGLPRAEIVDFARLYGSTKRSFIRARLRLLARSATARRSMFAVTCLPAVTGAWQHRGRRRALLATTACCRSTRP